MIYLFDGYSLDSERRELRRGRDILPVEPQVFDLLQYLIVNRERVVSKDDILSDIWKRRIVSESTLSSRITAVRRAVGDTGEQQRLIRTLARKGFRFVGSVREQASRAEREAANETLRTPTGDATSSPPNARRAGAERRQLTIMTCGVVGAATMTGRVDPEDVGEFVLLYRRCLGDVVERHGGYVARYSDDGIVGYFGYPRAREDDAERAVRAALAAVKAVSELASSSTERLQARVGLATGLVLVADAASPEGSAERSVMGETPLVAARLQDLARPGEVVIAESTRRLVGGLFEYRDLGQSGAKTGEGSLEAAQVIRESAIASRFEALRPSRRQLVGREEELELLSRRWTEAKSGEGRVVLIWGEPGIGKSHLVASFQDALARETHTSMRYFCSPSRMETALYPVTAQLERAAGFEMGDSDATKLEKLRRLLALETDVPGDDVALLAELLSVSTSGRYKALALSSQRRKELLLESFIGRLGGLAARNPVVIVLEDAHWIDPTTRELFDIVVERVRDLRVLLVMTYRPEFKPPWLGRSHVMTLTLNRLDRRISAALVRQVAGGKSVPDDLLEQIVARTDGVPLFIEELTKSILESGLLLENGDGYVLDGRLPEVAVPSSLQASLVARLDRIPSAREVVQTGAALGREFRYAALRAVMSLPDAELGASLDQLVATELVDRRGDVPHAVYIFKHALVQDAAYETIPRSERPRMHRRIVEVFEQQFPELAAHHPDVLAHHCREGNLSEKAIDYSISAARIALARSAGVEAHAQVDKAMSLAQAMPAGSIRKQLEGRLYHALGDALVMTQGFASPQVMAAMSKARELLDDRVNSLDALGALCGLFNYHLIRSESPACLKLVESRLRDRLDRPAKTVIHYLVGAAHLHLGNFRQSIDNLEKSSQLYEEEACRQVSLVAGYHLRSFILTWLSLGYLYVGSLRRAAETVAAAVSDARSRTHPFTLVSALLALARFRIHTNDLEGAIAATEEGMTIAAEQRSPYHVSRASVLRAVNLIESGRAEEGIAIMENALAAHHATGANFQSSYNISCLALANARAGRSARANALADEAIAEVDRTGERWWEAEAHRLRGEILLQTSAKGRDEAEACFLRAHACARKQDARLWELNAALSLARLWSTHGERARVRRLLAPICEAFGDEYPIEALRAARGFLDPQSPASAQHAPDSGRGAKPHRVSQPQASRTRRAERPGPRAK